MQTENRLFDDLARVASGAINTLGGLREEIELRVKERVERFAAEMDLVSREEFDAVKAMAAKARAEQEKLGQRVAELEQALAKNEDDEPTPAKRQAGGSTQARSQGGKTRTSGSSGGSGSAASGSSDKSTS